MTRLRFRLDGRTYDVELRRDGDARIVVVDGHEVRIEAIAGTGGHRTVAVGIGGHHHVVHRRDLDTLVIDGDECAYQIESIAPGAAGGAVGAQGAQVRPPMPGKVVAVRVTTGERVEAGQVLVVLEAMKMQNEITSPAAGIVIAIPTSPGAVVDVSDVLVTLGPASGPRAEEVVA